MASRNIVVVFDCAEGAELFAKNALGWMSCMDGKCNVTALYVINKNPEKSVTNRWIQEMGAKTLEKVEEEFSNRGILIGTKLREGQKIAEVRKEAEEACADFILIRKRRRGPVARLLSKDFSHELLHEVNVPVVIIPDKEVE